MLLYGDPKVGKSYAAVQLAVALSGGREWLSFPCPEPRKVVYIQLDTPRSLWASRLDRLQKAGLQVGQVLFADRETLQTYPFNILDAKHWIMLREAISQINPDAVIIDTLRECHNGDENDSTAMQAVIAQLEAAVKPAALILVSHGRKANPDTGPSLINDNRGSNYVVGRMDGIIHMSKSILSVGGRAVEEHTVRIKRYPKGDPLEGTWELTEGDKIKQLAHDLLIANKGKSLRQLARDLAELTDRTEASCLSTLRRVADSLA